MIAEAATDEQDEFMRGPFPEEQQHELSLARDGALRLHAGGVPARQDRAPVLLELRHARHPPDHAVLGERPHLALHGHARVRPRRLRARRQRLARAHAARPRASSSALHESQSRLWENVVGRSLPFWRWFFPQVQDAFPEVLADVDVERFHRAVNRVRPSFIRVDADEATYGLHIILRFELEQELLTERLSLDDLPEAWNARFKEYLGLDVPEDRLGVLQDVHWSAGSFGYFPTYQLGNVVSLQIWEKAREATPGRGRPDRARRVRRAPRVAAREPLRARPQVHAARRRWSASSAAGSTPSPTSATCARSSARERSRPRRDRSAQRVCPCLAVSSTAAARRGQTPSASVPVRRRSAAELARAPSRPRARGRAAAHCHELGEQPACGVRDLGDRPRERLLVRLRRLRRAADLADVLERGRRRPPRRSPAARSCGAS